MALDITHLTNDPLYIQVFGKCSLVDFSYDGVEDNVAFATVAEGKAFVMGLESACRLLGLREPSVENKPYCKMEAGR